jgi:N-methylhydantoinase B
MVRQQIAALPNGRYKAESFLDDDGVDLDHTLPVRVAVTIRDEEIEIDFSGMAEQTRGPLNSGRSGGMAAARVAFKSAIAPRLSPNEGAFRPLKVVLPDGKLISAVDNAAMSFWNIPLKTVIDTVYLALSRAMPDRIPAGHHAAQGLYTFYGRDAVTGFRYSTLDTTLGGWGAQPDRDGFSPLKTTTHGDTRNIPIEVEETFYPLQVERYEWRPDSAGPGEYRGGLGLRKIYRVLQDCYFVAAFERTKCPPWGLFGGKAAQVGCALVRQPGEEKASRYRKVTSMLLKAGATVELLSAGGGGRNPPTQRRVERVLEDVRQGYVSVQGAQRDYGVVIDAQTIAIDEKATMALRGEMQIQAHKAAESESAITDR